MTHPRPRAHVPTSATVAVSRLGEVLSRSTAADVLKMRDAMARIVQEYSPSETTSGASSTTAPY